MSNNEILTMIISKWAIFILILISLAIILGYLWNYFIIKELREMNRNLHQDLNRMMDVIANNRGPVQGQYIYPPINNQILKNKYENGEISVEEFNAAVNQLLDKL